MVLLQTAHIVASVVGSASIIAIPGCGFFHMKRRARELSSVKATLSQKVDEVETLTAALRAANDDLIAARDHARRDAKAIECVREEVLAIVAHDLRNPLNLISGTARLLLDGELPAEKQKQMLQVSVRAVQQ